MHQQEQSETKLIAERICHLQFLYYTTLVVIHIVCLCMCGLRDVGHSKAALVIAVSASAEKGLWQWRWPQRCTVSSAAKPQWVCRLEGKCSRPGHSECTSKYLNHLRRSGMGTKTTQAPPVCFSSISNELWNMCVCCRARPVSVCLTRATVLREQTREQHLVWNYPQKCVAKRINKNNLNVAASGNSIDWCASLYIKNHLPEASLPWSVHRSPQ